ncbi:MAG TPA: PilZ domain-containing protein [Elusimicrobiota bacterium]|nr:PilZ domain-containing protein [Elusimicrobiota bacterium]
MSGEERRRSARILSEFPLSLLDDKGELLDRHAVAHDVSDKGFKIESRAELKIGQSVRFSLSLDADGDIKGRARVVWCERTDLSYWAGAQFLKMSWADRRRVRRVTSPSDVDWNVLADKAIVALSVLLATLVGWRLLSSRMWRGVLGGLAPTAVAALALGWALIQLLKRR